MNTITQYEQITIEAAELARQFWVEIEAEFMRQAAQCQAGPPAAARIPSDLRLHEDDPLWSAESAELHAVCNEHD